MLTDEQFGIAANFVEGNSYIKAGARCYITWNNPGGAAERVQVWVRSIKGRPIVIMVAAKKLSNFRAVWIPTHVRDWKGVFFAWFKTKKEARQFAEILINE